MHKFLWHRVREPWVSLDQMAHSQWPGSRKRDRKRVEIIERKRVRDLVRRREKKKKKNLAVFASHGVCLKFMAPSQSQSAREETLEA